MPPIRPGQTARQWAEDVAKDPTCASCHYTINGLSFALQGTGADAMASTNGAAIPLDTSGWLDADLDALMGVPSPPSTVLTD